VFGIAMSTALLPAISVIGAHAEKDKSRTLVLFALRMVLCIVIPCACGLIILREPIVTLLFQRGAFDAAATARTARVLMYYVVGLWAYSGGKVFISAFYAMKDTTTPVRISVVSLIVNVVCNVIFMRFMAEAGLALATAISGMVQFFLLWSAFDIKMGKQSVDEVVGPVAKYIVASGIMSVIVVFGYRLLISWGVPLVISLPVIIVIGVIGYALGAALAGVPEVKKVLHSKKNPATKPE